jgi:histidinol-phosphatase (PHP family)
LLTKFEEKATNRFLTNPEYHKISEKYIREALRADCMFEVNTGAIGRGWRTAPYPHENLLRIIKAEGGKITLTSDCHRAEHLDCFFTESRKMLSDIGFEYIYTLSHGEWIKDYL